MKRESEFFEILTQWLRPPGRGIPTVSAGRGGGQEESLETLSQMAGRSVLPDEELSVWETLVRQRLKGAKIAVLGVPLDTGAGIRRGAAYGPRAIRNGLLKRDGWKKALQTGRCVDLGDVFVNPHLLHDEMLNPATLLRCQEAMYSQASAQLRTDWPVSGLSILEASLFRILHDFPQVRLLVLGGDHSVGWPITHALHQRYGAELGIVQLDAHTDLLEQRLGVNYCFGTWSFHAQKLIGPGKMVQLGIRQSGRDRGHWESHTGVKQWWAEEILRRSVTIQEEERLLNEIFHHLELNGVKKIYLSQDIDGTDSEWAAATGTPAEGGLHPDWVVKFMRRLGKQFEMVGADLVEVAPDLARNSEELNRTIDTAVNYVMESMMVLSE